MRALTRRCAGLAAKAPDAPLIVVGAQPGQRHCRRPFLRPAQGPADRRTPLERGETFTSFYTLGSPIALWMERFGDFSRPVEIPGKTSADPVIAAAAEWINFYDADDVLAFPLKGLSADYDRAVDEDRSVSVGAFCSGMSPVSHVAYWNDKAVIRPIANSLAWLWNARKKFPE